MNKVIKRNKLYRIIKIPKPLFIIMLKLLELIFFNISLLSLKCSLSSARIFSLLMFIVVFFNCESIKKYWISLLRTTLFLYLILRFIYYPADHNGMIVLIRTHVSFLVIQNAKHNFQCKILLILMKLEQVLQ